MWTAEQKSFCVETFILLKSFQETRQKFLMKFNLDRRKLSKAPVKSVRAVWVNKFRTKGTVLKQSPPGPPKRVRTIARAQLLDESVQRSPKRSTRHRSQAIGIKRTSMMRMLRQSKFKSYKLTVHRTSCRPWTHCPIVGPIVAPGLHALGPLEGQGV